MARGSILPLREEAARSSSSVVARRRPRHGVGEMFVNPEGIVAREMFRCPASSLWLSVSWLLEPLSLVEHGVVHLRLHHFRLQLLAKCYPDP